MATFPLGMAPKWNTIVIITSRIGVSKNSAKPFHWIQHQTLHIFILLWEQQFDYLKTNLTKGTLQPMEDSYFTILCQIHRGMAMISHNNLHLLSILIMKHRLTLLSLRGRRAQSQCHIQQLWKNVQMWRLFQSQITRAMPM